MYTHITSDNKNAMQCKSMDLTYSVKTRNNRPKKNTLFQSRKSKLYFICLFVLFCFVLFRFVSFRFVSFRFVLFCFVLFVLFVLFVCLFVCLFFPIMSLRGSFPKTSFSME